MFGKSKHQDGPQADNQQLVPEPVPHDSLGASDNNLPVTQPSADEEDSAVLVRPSADDGDGPPPLQQSEPTQPQPALDAAENLSESTNEQVSSVTPSQPQVGQLSKIDDSDLLDIKQQALQALDPLVDKLDQTPEEKFRTTMMMIQATDNPNLIKSAYESAQKISDEKVRAQALLDVVNEINYFTQHPQD